MVEVYELWIVIVSLIVVRLGHWIYQWSNPKCNGKLPPGSMGFPIIGETFEFIKPHDALQFSTFIKERILRWSMKAEIKVTRSLMLRFPHGCDVQISEDTKVDNSVGY